MLKKHFVSQSKRKFAKRPNHCQKFRRCCFHQVAICLEGELVSFYYLFRPEQ
jgi:hypothetical protein